MIIKLHGTSGAGKTTVARQLMKMGVVHDLLNGLKTEAYAVQLERVHRPLYIIGSYAANCGGCDSLTASEQIELVQRYAALGHVLYEGLLASEYYGRLGAMSEQYGRDHIFAFLDTPIEVCLDRVRQRRLAKGNTKPLNEDNTRGRVKKIEALKQKLLRQGRSVITLDYTQADSQTLDLLESEDYVELQRT